jgi:hypothetical protein
MVIFVLDGLISTLHLARTRRESPLDPENIDFIQKRLGSVALTEPSNPTGFIPKRLVDVGTTLNACPALVTLERPSDIKYATLSYCWGSPADAAKQLRTTTTNLEKYQRGLPQDEMPPIILDAVAICRALDIRYIWIDALCIVQGSDGDWEEQSCQMCEIFGNSYLTICAAASRSCLEGILETRQPPVLTLGHASVDGSKTGGLYSLRPAPFESNGIERYSIGHAAPLVQDLACSAWTQRGWVYQEKCLSLRKLYVGRNQIHLHIGDSVVSENGHAEDVSRQDPRLHRDWPKNVTLGYLAQHRHVRDYWYELVEQVASLQWTQRLDVFPSISGLASRFQDFINSPYLAGLWADDLHCGLLWQPGEVSLASPGNTMPGRLGTLRELLDGLRGVSSELAPSWSWAGRQPGRCTFAISTRQNLRCRVRTHLRREFDLLESRVELKSPLSPLGRLRYASLHLSGRTIVPRIMIPSARSHGENYLVSLGQDGMLATLFLDWGKRNKLPKDIEDEARAPLLMLLVSSCCAEPSLATDQAGMSTDLHARSRLAFKSKYGLSFLNSEQLEDAAGSSCRLCADQDALRDIWGLVIHPASRPGTYLRVGMFVSRADQGGMLLFEGSTRRTVELL